MCLLVCGFSQVPVELHSLNGTSGTCNIYILQSTINAANILLIHLLNYVVFVKSEHWVRFAQEFQWDAQPPMGTIYRNSGQNSTSSVCDCRFYMIYLQGFPGLL